MPEEAPRNVATKSPKDNLSDNRSGRAISSNHLAPVGAVSGSQIYNHFQVDLHALFARRSRVFGGQGYRTSDRVMGIAGGGAYAELCRIDYRMVVPVPASLDLVEAGA